MQTLTQSNFVNTDAELGTSKMHRFVPLGSAGLMSHYYESTPVNKRVLLLVLVLHLLVFVYFFTPTTPALPVIEEIPITVSLLQEISNAPIIEPTEMPTPKPPEMKKQTRITPEKVLPLPVKQTPSAIEANEVATPTTETPTVPVVEHPPMLPSKPSSESTKLAETTLSDTITPKADDVEPPKFGVAYLNNPKPEYSRLSRRASEQGKVLLRVLVNEQGLPASVEISKGSGFDRLDESALEAVKKWRFVPAKRNNIAISAYVTVPIQFSLD